MSSGGDFNLHKIKDFLNKLKVSFTKYLTPLSYLEYMYKSFFILRVKNLRILSFICLGINILGLILSFIYSIFISPLDCLISLGLTQLMFEVLIKIKKKRKQLNVDTRVKVFKKEFSYKKARMPEELKDFIE